MIWLVLGLPLVGAIIQALFGGKVVAALGPAKGRRVMGTLAVLPIAIAFVIGVMLTSQLASMPENSRHGVETLFNWIQVFGITIPFEAIIDPLAMTMVLIITGIGALIHLYATGYMAEEKDYPRFFTYLNLFIACMLILVLGNNLALMFIGWEGVGLCSYLLIGFWYKDVNNAKAANKAFIVNRIGDWGFTLGIFMIVMVLTGNWAQLPVKSDRLLSYDVVIPNLVHLLQNQPGIACAIALLLFVGAMGKSAQFPLYFWLPDAMAGPTPVSALIHAATMVTAGVVLLNRMHAVFEMSPLAGAIVAIIGAFTALFAALIAFGQTDIKKVLAYSTVSQLGFMFIACGVGAYWVGIFHVTTHAFFKALLFLGSGAVIHAMSHDQDMRHYGNLLKYLKITGICMIIGWLAIAGFPGLSGFWSKEAIIGGAFGNHYAEIGGIAIGPYVAWVALGVALLTSAYMSRLTWLTFFGPKEQWRALPADGHGHEHHDAHTHDHAHDAHHHGEDVHGFFYTDEELATKPEVHEHHHALDHNHQPKEVPPSMWVPLVVLGVLSVAGGWVLHNNHLLQHWLYPEGLAVLPKEAVAGHPHGWLGEQNGLLILSIGVAALGMFYGWLVYRKGLPEKERSEKTWSPFRRAAGAQFGYDGLIMESAVKGGGDIARVAWLKFDAGFIDGLVNGIAWITGQFGRLFRVIQTGFVRGYALMMLVAGVAILGYFAYVLANLGGGK